MKYLINETQHRPDSEINVLKTTAHQTINASTKYYSHIENGKVALI